MNRAGADDQKQAVVVTKDEVVNFLPGAGDEFSLRRGFGQRAQELIGRRQDPELDYIEVRSLLHRGSKLLAGGFPIKPAIRIRPVLPGKGTDFQGQK